MSFSVGQLFMAGFEGLAVPDALKQLLREDQLGGVVLFARNITSLDQLRAMVTEIRQAAGRPVLVAVDHEGGRVFRMPAPFTPVPPMAHVGRYAQQHPDGDQLAFQLGKMMGVELRTVGININFAPVLDINTNPDNPIIGDRAFSQDRDLVARLGAAMIRGLAEGGVIACGKHFPGHGDTPEDSHCSLPVLPHTWQRLRWMELVPFQAAIREGVPMLMTAHIVYGAIDAANPVSLSGRAIRGLLRDELGFDGVIVSDDLEMGAIRAICAPEDAAVRALAAGTDLVLICRDLDTTARAIARARAAVASGELSEAVLAQSALRLARLTKRVATGPSHDLTRIGTSQHRALVKRLA